MADFVLQNMVETTLPYELKTPGQRANRYFQTFLSFCVLDDFFQFFKKYGFWGILALQNMVKTTLPDGLEISSHMPGATCQMSGVTCHVSRVTCHFFLLLFHTKWWGQLVDGLSKGPTPYSFFFFLIYQVYSSLLWSSYIQTCKKLFFCFVKLVLLIAKLGLLHMQITNIL